MDDRTTKVLASLCQEALSGGGLIVALTGAGISAESGIPTFRGEDGYWRVGSRNYRPEYLATRSAFHAIPADVWSWYLHRLRTCRQARPNRAHFALAALGEALEERFVLITQNVDGLHHAAGSPLERSFEIHGNLRRMRCFGECRGSLCDVPPDLVQSGAPDLERLRCAQCGSWMRPHVLWFDECYDEERFRWDSSMRAAAKAELLLVVGTTGTTNLPRQIARRVVERGGGLIVIGPELTEFAAMAQASSRGLFLQGRATEHVPAVAVRLGAVS